MTVTTHSAAETEQFAADFALTLPGGACVALFGDLGAGKTALVRGLARGLGISETVSSPTYALVREYHGQGVALAHFDMYRVTTWADLESCGFMEALESDAYLAVEWSENIVHALPPDCVRVHIARGTDDQTRVIELAD
ncbi:MAG: tRNA (adenosine(37)-N6)-threonylcarbamoyltransferase complex ATPase subunit type 1 TsaE [Oscillospiraceae bacterium]|jgi:tRNA threonylcarbamoyladenosine biosynthesis protein TsaE|nr:tRNA (adenosine(37)-N6)-threonylcarbamoyltransferase complex ATPase subunit type 1 TsaE [Oscillospiraceae bacterium]